MALEMSGGGSGPFQDNFGHGVDAQSEHHQDEGKVHQRGDFQAGRLAEMVGQKRRDGIGRGEERRADLIVIP